MRKLFTILSLALAAFLVAPGAASAGTYGPAEDATVSDSNPAPGEPFTFAASGFQANSQVTITVNTDEATVTPAGSTVRAVTANSSGVARATITIDVEGRYTISASGIGADGRPLTVSETVVVGDGVAGSGVVSDGGENLPRTGSDGVAAQLWAGVGMLGLGAGLVALTVTRRRVTASV